MSRHMKSMPASASTTVTSGEPMRVPERGPLFRQPAAGKVRARAFARECSKFFWHQSRALPASPPRWRGVHTVWRGGRARMHEPQNARTSPRLISTCRAGAPRARRACLCFRVSLCVHVRLFMHARVCVHARLLSRVRAQ